MKRILALIIVALVVPSVALAGKPADPGKPSAPGKSQDTHGNSQSANHPATVMYVLKGVITGITNASSTSVSTTVNTAPSTPLAVTYPCDGWVTINVTRVNHKRVFKALTDNNTTLTLNVCLNAKTKVIVKGQGRVALTDLGTVGLDTTNGNYGVVKVRYALKSFDPTTSDGLTGFLKAGAKQVVVKKPATPKS